MIIKLEDGEIIETEFDIVIKLKGECDSCKGTGLYEGMGEGEGAAVICYYCHGKGYRIFEQKLKKFIGLQLIKNVTRVFAKSGQYVLSTQDIDTDAGTTIHFSRFGCSYKDWLRGAVPIPIKDMDCPYQHTDQNLQCEDKNNLYKDRCYKGTRSSMSITNCKFYNEKHFCWQIYDGKE